MSLLYFSTIVRFLSFNKSTTIFTFLLCFTFTPVFSQFSIDRTSLDNKVLNWESSNSWNPYWLAPQSDIYNYNITIDGYVSKSSTLTMNGITDTLTINDTLVIYGNLELGNNNKVIIKSGGILIVRGSMTLRNQANIISKGYVVITGDFTKMGHLNQGTFTSTSPSNVYVGGNVTDNLSQALYPVFNCPGSSPYPSSSCSYGNMTDLAASPINSFFESTCNSISITSSSSNMCVNDSRTLTGNISDGVFTIVSGPGTLTGNVLKATSAGNIIVKFSETNRCLSSTNQTIVVKPLPSPQITLADNSGPSNDGKVCAGGNVSLTASGGNAYCWSSGENTAAIVKNTAGNYTVTVTDVNGCVNTANAAIVVYAIPLAHISITESSGISANDGTICSGQSATLTANVSSGISWSTGATASSITVNNAGKHKLTVTGNYGCTNADSVTLAITPKLGNGILVSETSGVMDNDGVICKGAEAVLSASGGAAYLWSTGENISSVRKKATGTYSVVVTDENNCKDNFSTTITVNDLPLANLQVTETSGALPNDGIICSGAVATINVVGGSGFLWSTGETTRQIFANTSGKYSVNVSDANNCVISLDTTILVQEKPVVEIAVSESSGIYPNDGVICAGEKVNLTATGGISYNWSTGETNSQVVKSTPGTYSVTATDINNCENTSNAVISVNALPVASIAVTENSGLKANDGIICDGSSVMLTASGGINFIWSGGENTASINKTEAGKYKVTVIDANFCKSSDSITIVVNPLPVVQIASFENSGLMPNDGILCEGDTARLIATGGKSYSWLSGETSSGITVNKLGNYQVTATDNNGCFSNAQKAIEVNKVISFAGNDAEVCSQQYVLNANVSSGQGIWSVVYGGEADFIPNDKDPQATFKPRLLGDYRLKWTVFDQNCQNSSEVQLTFYKSVKADAGIDQSLNYAFKTSTNATLSPQETGTWTLLSGAGKIQNANSPISLISDLNKGVNKFLWTVNSDNCTDSDTLTILVNNIFIPNIITPNGDSKNNFFVIDDIEQNSPAALTIFNRWGNEVYKNDDYKNSWDGRNINGDVLPSDTYFYVLKLGNGQTIKSFVVIKR